MQDQTQFVNVILPLAIAKLYTYRIPRELTSFIEVGHRVVVSFGAGRKLYTAVVQDIHDTPPKEYEAKYVEGVLDETPIVNQRQLELWKWIQEYYMCSAGEVMTAALPGALKLSSESNILLTSNYKELLDELNDNEYLIIEALEVRNVLSLSDVSDILGVKSIHSYIKSLLEKKVIQVAEELKAKYKPKTIPYLKLTESASSDERLKHHFDELSRAPKQLEALMTFIHLKGSTNGNTEIRKSELQQKAGIGASIINQLIKKEILELYHKQIGRIDSYDKDVQSLKKLNDEQENALEEIKRQFQKFDSILLHGVTSSGKTEVYIHMIEEVIRKGKQVLYLLPEIALTTQIIFRLQKHFGDRIGVYHSKFNENERVEVWNTVLNFSNQEDNKYQIILGARSAVFLPFENLGLIIVDEEHENTFKQYDPAPRYHARDTATVLAKIHGAKVLLGSATPSVESYWNAQQNKYGYVALKKRYGGVRMPEIMCADIKEDTRKKRMKSHFSPLLISLIEEALENKEQIILFQNRRGYAPILMCETCGHVPQCKNCDVSLTYHKYLKNLNCHYCSHSVKLPKTCAACGSAKITLKGFGTEKIEEELALFFPTARISRMDLDTTRAKNAYQNIIFDFENGEVDVLVGTQMVTKGLDFDKVAVVGILNADNMLNFPDFRAFERSFQLMSQVSGRAGRKAKRGKVLIQSFQPTHSIIRNVMDYNYEEMYKNEIIERRNFHYPPFFKLIGLTLRHKDIDQLNTAVWEFYDLMKSQFGDRVLGPQTPVVSRIRNYYHKNFLIKIERELSLKKVKTRLQEMIIEFGSKPENKSVRIKIDVDPF